LPYSELGHLFLTKVDINEMTRAELGKAPKMFFVRQVNITNADTFYFSETTNGIYFSQQVKNGYQFLNATRNLH